MTARTDVSAITELVMKDLATVHASLTPEMQGSEAWAGIEQFVNLSLRVLAKTNPSKVRSEAVTLEIHSLMRVGGK